MKVAGMSFLICTCQKPHRLESKNNWKLDLPSTYPIESQKCSVSYAVVIAICIAASSIPLFDSLFYCSPFELDSECIKQWEETELLTKLKVVTPRATEGADWNLNNRWLVQPFFWCTTIVCCPQPRSFRSFIPSHLEWEKLLAPFVTARNNKTLEEELVALFYGTPLTVFSISYPEKSNKSLWMVVFCSDCPSFLFSLKSARKALMEKFLIAKSLWPSSRWQINRLRRWLWFEL